MRKTYTFREITNRDELKQFFKLRYDIYSTSSNKAFIKSNEKHLDIDYFDIHAKHYCLMNGANKAGYLRAVLPKEDFTNNYVIEIGEQYSLINRNEYFVQNATAPYPFLSYAGVPKSHWNFYNKLSENNERITEGSRLILRPEHRTIRTSKLLIECSIVLCVLTFTGQKHAVINCAVEHGAFYEAYGFKEIDEVGSYSVNGLNKVSLTLPLSLSSVPEHYHERFLEMAQELQQTGKIEKEL